MSGIYLLLLEQSVSSIEKIYQQPPIIYAPFTQILLSISLFKRGLLHQSFPMPHCHLKAAAASATTKYLMIVQKVERRDLNDTVCSRFLLTGMKTNIYFFP